MKKLFLVLAFASLTFVSCKDNATETSEPAATIAGEETAMSGFVCPMDCENGKTYEVAGKCPVCEMDLASLEANAHEGHDHEGHDHSDHEGHNH